MSEKKTLREDINIMKLATIAEWLCTLDMGKTLDDKDFVVSRVASGYLLALAQQLLEIKQTPSLGMGRIFTNDL